MSDPRNDIDTLQERIAYSVEGIEVDLGNGVTGLAVNTYGSSPGCLLVDVVWWVDGVRHSERLSERELGTTATAYLSNSAPHNHGTGFFQELSEAQGKSGRPV